MEVTGQCPGSLTYAFEQLEQISARPFGNVLGIYLRMGRHHILQSLGRGEKEVKLQSRGWKVGSRNVVDGLRKPQKRQAYDYAHGIVNNFHPTICSCD